MGIFSKEIVEFIKNNAIGIGNQELTDKVNSTFNTAYTLEQIKRFKAHRKISSGLTGYFGKEHTPHNKGKKWDDWLTKEAQTKAKQTCFTKEKNINNQRHNWCEVGEERITKDGYIIVRVSEKRERKGHSYWIEKQRLIYEEHNGRIPVGSAIIFADGDKRNFDIDNLLCVSRAELLKMNTNDLIKEYGEATKVGLMIAKLHIKMNEVKRRNKC